MSRIKISGLDQVRVNMDNAPKNIIQDLKGAAITALEALYQATGEHAGLTDHSLEDLALMGHPYGKNKPANFPHKDDLVHIQSGTLYDNIEKEMITPKNHIIIMVGVQESKVKYIRHLIYGTSRMRPRDFLSATWLENQDKVVKIIKYGITSHMGSRKGVTGK